MTRAPATPPPTAADGLPGEALDDQAASLRRLMLASMAPSAEPESGLAPEPTADRPAEHQLRLRRAEAHAGPPMPAPAMRRMCPIVCVTSGKGGVGKTCLSVNLAAVLPSLGRRVTLVDADFGLANAHLVCGVASSRISPTVDMRPGAFRRSAIEAPGGFRLIPGTPGLASLADLDRASRRRLVVDLLDLTSDSDLLLVDTGAGAGATVRNFALAADYVMLVTTPDPAAMADAYALLKCLCQQGASPADVSRRTGLVVNQASSMSEGRAVATRFVTTAERYLGVVPAVAGVVPRDRSMVRAVRARRPIVIDQPRSAASRACGELGGRVSGLVAAWSERTANPRPSA